MSIFSTSLLTSLKPSTPPKSRAITPQALPTLTTMTQWLAKTADYASKNTISNTAGLNITA